MENFNKVFGKFLSEQEKRLKEKTFRNYIQVIELFEHYMNGYAYNYLEGEEDILLYEEKYNDEEKEFCEIFSIEKLNSNEISEFLDYFMIRKVFGSKELMKNTGTVMRKFIKWLKDNSYIDNYKFEILYETVNELKDDLPKVEALSELLYKEGIKNDSIKYEVYEERSFYITRVKAGKIWVKDYMGGDIEIGPVIVPEEISSAVKEGWSVYLELGRKDKNWYIIGSGNVYPY